MTSDSKGKVTLLLNSQEQPCIPGGAWEGPGLPQAEPSGELSAAWPAPQPQALAHAHLGVPQGDLPHRGGTETRCGRRFLLPPRDRDVRSFLVRCLWPSPPHLQC